MASFDIFSLGKSKLAKKEVFIFENNMKGTLEIIHGLIICLRNQLKANERHHVIWASILNILEHCEALLDELRQHGPTLKSRFLEWTDAGPGVGITSHDVEYRIAQRIRIMNADYLIRLHLSNGDSSHNEVERCQGFVGNAICYGGSIEWKHKKLLDDQSLEELQKTTSSEFESYELKRMQYNAFKVCEEAVSRVDGAPGPGGYLKAFKSKTKEDAFFYDKKFLDIYLSKSEKERFSVPGAAYYKKLEEFMESHCEVGMKHLEFVKMSCIKANGKICEFCEKNPWIGPPCVRVPRPIPDYDKLPEYHYQHVSVSPTDVNGVQRPVDDYQPTKHLKEVFNKGEVKLTDEESIETFCDKFIIDKRIAKTSLEHLQTLELRKEKRKLEKQHSSQEEDTKAYEDVDWEYYHKKNTLNKLKVKTLNKYLDHNKMNECLQLNKKEKCLAIHQHLAFKKLKLFVQASSNPIDNKMTTNEDDDNSDSVEEDVVVNFAGGAIDDEEDEDDTNDDTGDSPDEQSDDPIEGMDITDDISGLFIKTRSGRIANSWRTSYFK